MPANSDDPLSDPPHPGLAECVDATLVLLCKRPLLGQGKQRLAATFGIEETQYLAEGFLNCALEDLYDWPGQRVVAPASVADQSWAEQLLASAGQTAAVVAQQEGNLGQRIIALDQQLIASGTPTHQRRVYIGSDAPALTARHYREVHNQLNKTDVVLSAADDGGVAIMATAAPWPAELIDLPWSTDRLGHALAECCIDKGLSLSYIEPSYDIDYEIDLARLQTDLAPDPRAARQQLYQLLQSLLNQRLSHTRVPNFDRSY